MITIGKVINELEHWAPPVWQEGYDNSGLIVGQKNTKVTGIMVSLDCTPDVVDEAIANGCNLIVSHHPIVFKGLKRFNGNNYVEQTVIKAIKNDVALYAIHTNLDSVLSGVNAKIAEKIGVSDLKILSPKRQVLHKLVTYVPKSHQAQLRDALANAGAGNIGNYSYCSFSSQGEGRFKAMEGSAPHVGEQNEVHVELEVRIEVTYPYYKEGVVISAMKSAHPYEEVSYQITKLENQFQEVGIGVVGKLAAPQDAKTFLTHVKQAMNVECVKYTNIHKSKVETIAICGGSGSFLLGAAKGVKADVYITADFKYHEFFDAENKIIIADIGHYESEQYTSELISEYLSEKFATFAIRISAINTNPVNYL